MKHSALYQDPEYLLPRVGFNRLGKIGHEKVERLQSLHMLAVLLADCYALKYP